jgi:hypothetical protein
MDGKREPLVFREPRHGLRSPSAQQHTNGQSKVCSRMLQSLRHVTRPRIIRRHVRSREEPYQLQRLDGTASTPATAARANVAPRGKTRISRTGTITHLYAAHKGPDVQHAVQYRSYPVQCITGPRTSLSRLCVIGYKSDMYHSRPTIIQMQFL